MHTRAMHDTDPRQKSVSYRLTPSPTLLEPKGMTKRVLCDWEALMYSIGEPLMYRWDSDVMGGL